MKGLCAARKAAGMTQVAFAAAIGIDRSTVAKWETGKAYPRADMLPAIAEALSCSIDDLYAAPAGAI